MTRRLRASPDPTPRLDSPRSDVALLSRAERARLARVQLRQLEVLRRVFPGLRVR